jgi:hypothetical protein
VGNYWLIIYIVVFLVIAYFFLWRPKHLGGGAKLGRTKALRDLETGLTVFRGFLEGDALANLSSHDQKLMLERMAVGVIKDARAAAQGGYAAEAWESLQRAADNPPNSAGDTTWASVLEEALVWVRRPVSLQGAEAASRMVSRVDASTWTPAATASGVQDAAADYCPYCGAKVMTNPATFCTMCGKALPAV